MATRGGITLTQAIEQAIASDMARVVLVTYELFHPLGTPAGAIYVVNNNEPIVAYKEFGAARDPTGPVEFMATKVSVQWPEENDSASAPDIGISIGNVSSDMADAVRRARGSLENWELIERIYMDDNLITPHRLPVLTMTVTRIEIGEQGISLRASIGNPGDVAVPSATFKRSEYPGLVGG